jgi:hypothetical protein
VQVTDTGAALTAGSVKCDATVGHRRLRVIANAFRDGRAVCAWSIPRGAKGRHVIGRLRVRADGKQAVRWFSRRVA